MKNSQQTSEQDASAQPSPGPTRREALRQIGIGGGVGVVAVGLIGGLWYTVTEPGRELELRDDEKQIRKLQREVRDLEKRAHHASGK